MNTQEALSLHAQFLELKKLVEAKVPPTITLPDCDKQITYQLVRINLENLTAHYSTYIGCGDYEYASEHIDLATLFGD